MSHTNRRRSTRNAWDQGMPRRIRLREQKQRPVPRKRPEVGAEQRSSMVTDRAIVRWLERVTGIDVRGRIEADMLADGRDQLVAEIGQGKIHLAAYGVYLLVKNGKVVTVSPEGAIDG